MIALGWGQRRKEVKNHFVSSHFLIFDSEMKNYVESRWEYWQYISSHKITFSVCDEGAGLCAMLMTVISLIMILVTLPFSLFFVVKVVQVRFNILIFLSSNFSGIWKSSHLQTWKTVDRRSKRTWSILCYSLCGCLWEDWHEITNLWNSSSRSEF